MPEAPRALELISSVQPPSAARTWLSAPHPYLPLVATASSDKTVRVYSLTAFNLVSTISGGHKRSVRTCAWKPGVKGESVLATGSFDASAGIWRRWNGPIQDSINFTSEGGEAGDEEEEDEDYRFAVLLDGPSSEIKSVAWNASGQFLATSSRDKSVWIWEELEDDNFETVAVLGDHEGDVKCVAWHPQEDLLASCSYDDTIRLWKEDVDDWVCVAVLEGWEGTVWWVDFEGITTALKVDEEDSTTSRQKKWLKERERSGPRLISCSDDLSIRIWRRKPKENQPEPTSKWGMPSILRSSNIEEEWIEEAKLPQTHERSIYCAAWSKQTGRVVSSGSDGRIVVYEERWALKPEPEESDLNSDTMAHSDTVGPNPEGVEDKSTSLTEWAVVAEFEGAHDVYEINHVCWAKRYDKGKISHDEEAIISTGDDGEVKVWSFG